MRKKRSIRKKFLTGYLLIFSLSLALALLVLTEMLNRNSENLIKKDMEQVQKYSREYTKQFILLNNLSENAFSMAGGTLVQELSENLQSNVMLYNSDGTFLFEAIREGNDFTIVNVKPSPFLKKSSNADLLQARQNKASLTITKIEKKNIVYFSYPLYINGEQYGIVRVSKNYDDLFKSNQNVLFGMTAFILFLFITIFLFSYVLSSKITKPLFQLTQSFNEVANGNYDPTLDIKTGDEIEELTAHFNEMKRKIKEQIITIQEEKETIEKLESSRREFFNNVTHELKTPLTTISGYAQILSDEDFNDKEFLYKAATRIRNESDRLHEMVVEVIELSKRNMNEMGKVSLDFIVKQACEDLEIKASRYGMSIQYDLIPLFVNGNENMLSEVMINLLDNSIKYGKNDSNISVSLTQKDYGCLLELSNECSESNEQIIQNAFEPFYRGSKTKKEEKGSTGLGLYISKQVVEDHHGTIDMSMNNDLVIAIKLPTWQQIGNK